MSAPEEAAPGAVAITQIGPTPPAAQARTAPASRRRPLRGVLSIVAAVLALIGAWVLLRTGVQADVWPAFLPDAGPTSITRYSGPWITAAAAAALVAGLLLLLGSVDLVRYRRSARLSE